MRPFQDLIVWQKAHALTLRVHRDTAGFPKQEEYGIVSQMRRSASSVAYNIVEGSAFDEGKQFHRYLGLALGSATELEYQLILARDLGYLKSSLQSELDADLAEIKKMLVSFRKRLRDTNS